MWSLGCTLFSLAFGRSPFENDGGVQRLGKTATLMRVTHRTVSWLLCFVIGAREPDAQPPPTLLMMLVSFIPEITY